MEALGATVVRAGAFLILSALVFVPAERLWAARRRPSPRAGLATDLTHALADPLIVNAVAALLFAVLATAADLAVPAALRRGVGGWSVAAQLAVALLAGEVLLYFAHRALHAVPALWRLHAVHHSSESLDWLSAHRQHPVEQAALLAVANLPALVLGVPLSSFVALVLLQRLHTTLVHANVRLPLGPLRRVVAGPDFHRLHHTHEHARANYASLLPVLDWLFGTYEEPGYGTVTPGTPERVARSWWGQLWLKRS